MHILWTSHIKDEGEKTDFQKYVENSTALLNRLADIITKKIEAAEAVRIGKKNFEMPSWAYDQADTNGYIRALKEIRAITNRKE